MGWADLFDKYSLRARVQPAFFTLLPLAFTIAVWFPSLHKMGSALFGLALTGGLIGFLAHFSRTRGRSVEPGLFKEWGGKTLHGVFTTL